MAEKTDVHNLYDKDGGLILGGSGNAYTAVTSRDVTGYHRQLRICGKAGHSNSGAATLNVNGLGAVAIRKNASAALVTGDIISGQYYDFAYDEANGWFQILNPSLPSALDAATLDGFDTSTSGNRWGVIPVVGSDGVMEVGRYIDFHNSDADTGDAANRLETNGGTAGLFESPNLGALKRITSLTHSTLAQGDVIYYDGSNFVRLAPDTAGKVLQTGGAAANPSWSDALTLATEQATTSGTAFDFSSPIANPTRITIAFNEVSLSGSEDLLVQIGDSGGIEATGYVSSGQIGNTILSITAGFIIAVSSSARVFSGIMTLVRVNALTWVASHDGKTATTLTSNGGGSKALSATLDRVRITNTNIGTNSFDAGSVSVLWE